MCWTSNLETEARASDRPQDQGYSAASGSGRGWRREDPERPFTVQGQSLSGIQEKSRSHSHVENSELTASGPKSGL